MPPQLESCRVGKWIRIHGVEIETNTVLRDVTTLPRARGSVDRCEAASVGWEEFPWHSSHPEPTVLAEIQDDELIRGVSAELTP